MTLPPTVSKALLRTSYPPTNEQRVVAKRTLEKGARSLRDLEYEISRLRKMTSSLSLEKQAISTFVNNHRTLLSPFNRLLSDIIGEIFYHCLPIAHNSIMSIDEAPLSLGRVCSSWRQILYSTPKLWTSIHIVTSNLPQTSARSSRDLLRLDAISSWLSRSGVLPISISLLHEVPLRPGRPAADSRLPPEVDIIASHANRWKSIHLNVREGIWLPQFLTKLHPSDYPVLENIRIEFPNGWASEPIIAAFLLNHGVLHAPRLRSLALSSPLIDDARLQIYWQSLTALEITYDRPFCFNRFVHIMTSCSSLETCAINLTRPWGSSWDSSTPSVSSPIPHLVTLPHLRSFTFITKPGHDGSICQVLEVLMTPVLTHLTYKLSAPRSRGWWVGTIPSDIIQGGLVQRFHAFFKRLVNPLEELDLCLDCYKESVLLDILRAVPGLKRLSLGGRVCSQTIGWDRPSYSARPLGDLFLCYFNRPQDATEAQCEDHQDSHSICPNLEIAYFSGVGFSCQAILQFLRSRTHRIHHQNGLSRLRKVKITFFNSGSPSINPLNEIRDPDMTSQLAVLEKDTGLQAYLEYIEESPASSPPSERRFFNPYAGVSIADLAPMPP